MILRILRTGAIVKRMRGCNIYHPRRKKDRSAGLDRCRKYALGCGALYAKHLALQPWRRKPGIFAVYARMLGYSLGGMTLNLARPGRAYYYLNSLWYKLQGSLEYGFSAPPRSGDG
jgi:hypothetical protein